MSNIRCTTMQDGTMYHTLQVGNVTHILGVVRTKRQVAAGSRVNIMVSRSLSAMREGHGG